MTLVLTSLAGMPVQTRTLRVQADAVAAAEEPQPVVGSDAADSLAPVAVPTLGPHITLSAGQQVRFELRNVLRATPLSSSR
jgi:hypothetical protein